MSNLIITIISLALIAVAAVMAIFYGGMAFINQTAQVRANTLLNEVHQAYSAATQYGLDRGLSNFGSDFSLTDVYSASGYLSVPLPLTGIPRTWNAYGMDENCSANMDGEWVMMWRGICQINGKNVVQMLLSQSAAPIPGNPGGTCNTFSGTFTSAASASLPIVQLAVAINKTLGLPPGLSISGSGLPYALDGSSAKCATPSQVTGGTYYDGSDKFNYCYLDRTGGHLIMCSFTN